MTFFSHRLNGFPENYREVFEKTSLHNYAVYPNQIKIPQNRKDLLQGAVFDYFVTRGNSDVF